MSIYTIIKSSLTLPYKVDGYAATRIADGAFEDMTECRNMSQKSIDKTNIADVAKRTGDADHKALMNTCKRGEGKSPRKLSLLLTLHATKYHASNEVALQERIHHQDRQR